MKYRKLMGTLLATSLVFSMNIAAFAETTSIDASISQNEVASLPIITTFEDALKVATENDISLQKALLDKQVAEKNLSDSYDVDDLVAGESLDSVASTRVTKEQALKLAKNGMLVAEKTIDQEKIRIKNDLEGAVLNYLAAKESLDLASKNNEQAKKNYDIIQTRFKLGLITKADVLQAESMIAQSNLGVQKAKSDLTLAIQSYNKILFFPLDNPVTLQDEASLLKTTDDGLNKDDLIKKAKENRPDYLAQLPRIDTEREKVEIYYSVYRNKNNAKVFAQNIAAKKEELNLKLLDQNLELQIIQAIENINIARKQYDVAQKNLVSSQEVLRITEAKFKAGMSVELELISANNDVLSKQLAVVQAKYNLSKLYKTLNYIIGTEL